jgi:hypothetical protein
MNWGKTILQVPQLIGIAMVAVEKIKGAKGPEKERAVIETIHESLPEVEKTLGANVIDDAAFDQLLSTYIQARVALNNFLTKKAAEGQAVPEGIILPPK